MGVIEMVLWVMIGFIVAFLALIAIGALVPDYNKGGFKWNTVTSTFAQTFEKPSEEELERRRLYDEAMRELDILDGTTTVLKTPPAHSGQRKSTCTPEPRQLGFHP